ncbi:MAG: AAA family ATPase [Tenericutes bacterium]|jgi:hypothetical protein|nr:AAA family ATPase [Mycoplasmatota bacterium]
MITSQELLRIVTNHKNYTKSRTILDDFNTEWTIYSCTDEHVSKVVELAEEQKEEELEKLTDFIKQANLKETDINDIMLDKKTSARKEDRMDDFFEAFEDIETKERLFILMGETGVGKTYTIERHYEDIITIACNKALDPYTLCYYLSDKDGTGLQPYETPFLKAIREGLSVFLDEANELPHDTLMFLQGITDEKKAIVIGDEMVKIAKGFKIIMSLNPPSETDERMPLGDALLGRAVGYVMELTDEIICERLNVTENWLYSIRNLYNHIRNSGMIDMRNLDYRDYQKFSKYNFEMQLQFKVCMGDVTNIKEFRKIQSTGEYQELIDKVMNEAI